MYHFISVTTVTKEKIVKVTNYKRNIKNYNKIVFQNQLVENFSNVYNKDLHVDNLSKSIIGTFTETLNENALMVKMTKKKKLKITKDYWITTGLLDYWITKAIQIKTRWIKRFMKNKNKNSMAKK